MIELKRNLNGDTRTAKKNVSIEEFVEANLMHRADVNAVMQEIAVRVCNAGRRHDHTKIDNISDFYVDFTDSLATGKRFEKSNFYKFHVESERHHLMTHCPDDVNLLDVIEMIADMVCAGMTRSGTIYPIQLSPDVLETAVRNTETLIKDMITIKED